MIIIIRALSQVRKGWWRLWFPHKSGWDCNTPDVTYHICTPTLAIFGSKLWDSWLVSCLCFCILSMSCMSYKRNDGKLHGNISRNGYGNAMIGRYGGCFEKGIWRVYDTGEKCAVLERLAMVEGRKVCIIHGLTLVIKNSYTYCKSLLALEAKYYYASRDPDLHT